LQVRCSLKPGGPCGPSLSQPAFREPRENRGRLRHCYGLQTPKATVRSMHAWLRREGGARYKARSQDTGLVVLVEVPKADRNNQIPQLEPTSPSKRRMRPARFASAQWDSLDPSFSVLPGCEGFFVPVFKPPHPALVSQPKTRPRPSWPKRKISVMFRIRLGIVGLIGLLGSFTLRAQHASAVVSYDPGIGFSPGFTNPATVLGEPSRLTPGTFGGPVDPFDPPYLSSQLVSIGAGGSLTVKFSRPILNHPRNPFCIDFIIFGNSGFIITNAFDPNTFDWIGTPATDGSLFGNNSGASRVSVSRDGVIFYELNPALAPTVDGLFPTDGSGDFHTPTDPSLTAADFAGLPLEGIRALYYGSAGGAGYDISWARDKEGTPVMLPEINFVRVEVLSGKAEVDGFAAVFTPPG